MGPFDKLRDFVRELLMKPPMNTDVPFRRNHRIISLQALSKRPVAQKEADIGVHRRLLEQFSGLPHEA